MRDGLGQWTENDIAEYLKTGSNRHGSAVGPMAEVVNFTTSRLSDADLKAIAVYLKDMPGTEAGSVAKPADAVMQAGADRHSGGEGKSGSVRVGIGGGRTINKKNIKINHRQKIP